MGYDYLEHLLETQADILAYATTHPDDDVVPWLKYFNNAVDREKHRRRGTVQMNRNTPWGQTNDEAYRTKAIGVLREEGVPEDQLEARLVKLIAARDAAGSLIERRRADGLSE